MATPLAPLFHFDAAPGTYPVGLRVEELYDTSRFYPLDADHPTGSSKGAGARPIQTLIWYPARENGGNPMTVRDYGALWATETHFTAPRLTVRAKQTLKGMHPTLSLPLWAVRDAAFASGRFPVVIYAPSFCGVAWENADLCEYLASHGYLVLASPSRGSATREMTYDLEGINTQARDIAFLIGYAHSLDVADGSRTAVIGFSWGGISHLFAAARDPRITALVALDGSLRYSPGLVKRAGDVGPEHMTIPLLSFAQHDYSFEDQDRGLTAEERDGPSVLNAWQHGDLVAVHMLRLFHAEFSSMCQRNEDEWWKLFNVWPMMKADYGREDGIVGYAWMARYTLQFLQAYLNADTQAVDFLKETPQDNGVPRHVMAVHYRGAQGAPASFRTFREAVHREGFDHVDGIFASFLILDTHFTLTEESLRSWSDQLLEVERLGEALALLRFNLRLHPDSGSAHAALGAAYEEAGEIPMALQHYKDCLKNKPDEADVRRRVHQLSGLTHDTGEQRVRSP